MNGIPTLLNPSVSINVSLMTADILSALGSFMTQQWGIYYQGKPFAIVDTVVAIDHRKGWKVSNAPQEEGAFQSYNKVETPFESRVTLAKGGTESERNDFLTAIDVAAADLNLYDVVMPDMIFNNANITRYDFRRTARNGVSLLTVDIFLQEIRNQPTGILSNTKAPSGKDAVNGGTVQAATATPDTVIPK